MAFPSDWYKKTAMYIFEMASTEQNWNEFTGLASSIFRTGYVIWDYQPKSISVSGSAECAGSAYEAPKDFMIFFSYFFREIFGCSISIQRNAFWNEHGKRFMLEISNNITNSEKFVKMHESIQDWPSQFSKI